MVPHYVVSRTQKFLCTSTRDMPSGPGRARSLGLGACQGQWQRGPMQGHWPTRCPER